MLSKTPQKSLSQYILHPAAQETGSVLALIPQTIKAALAPLRQWIAQKEYNLSKTEKLLAQKLQNIKPEKIVSPEAYVAIPAIQAIAYCINNEELQNLYANLLANSMNIDTKESVHPSFVEIIKQMSPIDADIFKIIFEAKHTPLIDLSTYNHITSKNLIVKNISWITKYDYSLISLSLDNLSRLMLIDIQKNPSGNKDIYDMVKETHYYSQTQKRLHMRSSNNVIETYKSIQKTYLSTSFYKTCVSG